MKEIILIILVILLGYILPLIFAYRFVRIAYGKNGRWRLLNPDINDFMFTILPIANLVIAFTNPYPEGRYTWNKFFRVKK